MRITVDAELCQGHNRCSSLAPELFEVDDFGLSQAVNDGVVAADMEAKARLCIDNCPEFAIKIVEA
ncbi:MAG: ferredoxin [Chromatiales bacterium]|jgi:ferredoxin|nr:ferredoxin [Chromatiales bacterium]